MLYEDAGCVRFAWKELVGNGQPGPQCAKTITDMLARLKQRSPGWELLKPEGEAPIWALCTAAVSAAPGRPGSERAGWDGGARPDLHALSH